MTPEQLKRRVNELATQLMSEKPGMRWSEATLRAKQKLKAQLGGRAVREAYEIGFDKE